MALYKIGDNWYDPSVFEIGIQDVSAPDAGRDLDGKMHPLKKCSKITLKIEHWEIPIALAKQLIREMYVLKTTTVGGHSVTTYTPKNSFRVTYYDPILDAYETRNFYSGDKALPVRMWGVNSSNNPTKRAWYAKLTFNLIEI